jgi:hypothetical protein
VNTKKIMMTMNKKKEGGNITIDCCLGNGPRTHEKECNNDEKKGPENLK